MNRDYRAKAAAIGPFRRKNEAHAQALDSYEGIFQQLLGAAPVAIVVMDPNGLIALVNSQTENLFGYRQDELLGKPVEFLLPEPFRETHAELRKVCRSQPRLRPIGARTELFGRRKDGSKFPVEFNISPAETDQGVFVINIMRDITGRKQAETQIFQNYQSQAALRDINLAITSTLDLGSILDTLLEKIDLFLTYSSVTTIRLFNKETGELEFLACRNIPSDEMKAYSKKARRGLAEIVVESRFPLLISDIQTDPRSRDSSFFRKHSLLSYLGVPLIARDEVLGVLSFVTKEKHEFSSREIDFLKTLASQAAIAIQNSQLYEQIKKQAKQLEKANKIKNEFLSVMSHELRTPLNSILGYTGMMQDKMLGAISTEQEKALAKVMACSNDLLSMIINILNATKIGADESKVEDCEINLKHLLDDLRLVYDLQLNKELTLHWDYPARLPVVRTDIEKLKQVLQNLINNAIKFTAEGQVTVSVRHLAEANCVEFKVTDTGIGIPKKKIPIIFEMFRQADSSETRPYGGVGLGLYIVKKLTELLGGKIDVESEPGRGSAFTVTIPVS